MDQSQQQQAIMANIFRTNIEIMTDLALAISGKKWEYTDKELFHSVVIFMEVFMNFAFQKMEKEGNTFGEASKSAERIGAEFYEFVKKSTNIDLTEIYKAEGEEKVETKKK